MPDKPITHKRTPIANTGIFNIEQMDLEFSNGATRQYQRIVGSDQGAVLVVPMLDDDTVLLIREYAAGMDRYELCFPKGHIENGEDRLAAANREIQEEVGYAARQLEHIDSVTVAPGYLYHTTHIVLARNLYPQRLTGDEPEELEVVPWKISDFNALMQRDDFTEARSMVALYIIRDKLLNR
ncbi:MAG: ADP compounds hydrolase NudE [Chromatiales bacterium]|nr:ADP compounds hydrolase NudE [Chromatiales bacterium]